MSSHDHSTHRVSLIPEVADVEVQDLLQFLPKWIVHDIVYHGLDISIENQYQRMHGCMRVWEYGSMRVWEYRCIEAWVYGVLENGCIGA